MRDQSMHACNRHVGAGDGKQAGSRPAVGRHTAPGSQADSLVLAASLCGLGDLVGSAGAGIVPVGLSVQGGGLVGVGQQLHILGGHLQQ